MSRRDDALASLNAWMARQGHTTSSSNAKDWEISEYRDAFVFSPAGQLRSNLLYVALGTRVASFSPTTDILDEVYADLSNASNAAELE